MRTIRAFFVRLRQLSDKQRKERELADEMESHLGMHIDDNLRAGMNPQEARRQALLKLGGMEQTKEAYRDRRGLPVLETLWQDLRYAARMLRRNPGFAAVAVLSLALGIGANTAIFTLMDAVMWKMLPVDRPEELVVLNPGRFFPYSLYRELRDRNQALDGLLASGGFNQVETNAAEQINVQLVSGNYFTLLGVNAAIGRTFTQEEDRVPSANPVLVLSHKYWTSRFGSDPSVLGRTMILNDTPFTIVGVAPPAFLGIWFGDVPEVWAPLAMQSRIAIGGNMLTDPGQFWLTMIGRRKPGISSEQAQASLSVLYERVRQELYPAAAGKMRLPPADFQLAPASRGVGSVRQRLSNPLQILMAMVGLVLLIACANVANLLLGRATARRQEIAVRIAVGAGRARLIRALLTESVLLAVLGGAGGLLFAAWGTKALLAMSSFAIRIEPDARVLGFTLAISLLTGLLFGLAPAFRATRVGLQTRDRAALPLPKSLVVVQVALSLMLLIGAGLFIETLRNLTRLDAGFERDHVLVFLIDVSPAGYAADRNPTVARDVLERMSLLPGARSMSVAMCGMFSGCGGAAGFSLPGEDPRPGEERRTSSDSVGPRFFETMGIPMLEGRDFTMRDDDRASKVAIVNQFFAKRYFPGDSPLGKRFTLRIGPPVEVEIVGVVKDAKIGSLKEPARGMIYLPLLQRNLKPRMIAFRTTVPPYAMAARVREELRIMNSKIQVREISTMEEQVEASLSQERMLAKLAGFFAVLALVLACVGLYGVLSYSIARRTREIGVRKALGAARSDVLGMVLRESLILAVSGVMVGVAGALAVTRYTSSMLWGLTPHDPTTIAGAATLLLAVTLLAAYVPARRAARVDPMTALRAE